MPRDGKRLSAAPENRPPQTLRVWAVCWPIALSKAEGAVLSDLGIIRAMPTTALPPPTPHLGLCHQCHEACDVLRRDLHPCRCPKAIQTCQAEILVEVAQYWRHHDRLDPGRVRPFD